MLQQVINILAENVGGFEAIADSTGHFFDRGGLRFRFTTRSVPFGQEVIHTGSLTIAVNDDSAPKGTF